MLTPSTRSPGESVLTIAASSPPEPAVEIIATSEVVPKNGFIPSRMRPSIAANSGPRWLIIWRAPASRTEGGRAVGPGMRRLGSKRSTGTLLGLGGRRSAVRAEGVASERRTPLTRMVPRTAPSGWTARFGHLADTCAGRGVASGTPSSVKSASPAWSDPIRDPSRVPCPVAASLRRIVAGVLVLACRRHARDVRSSRPTRSGRGSAGSPCSTGSTGSSRGQSPDRQTLGTVRVTEPPATPSPTPRITPVPATPAPGATPTPTPEPTPTPTPLPQRVAVDVDIVSDHRVGLRDRGPQGLVRAGGRPDGPRGPGPGGHVRRRRSARSRGRVREWESYDDSHNGDWGPAAMALALRGVRRARLRDPGVRDAQRRPARRGRRDPGDRLAGRSCSPGAAPTPG